MGILHHKEKNICDQCGEKFVEYGDLINHARHIHHHPIVKCVECGKEFIHEKDRLHHSREEHERKVMSRELKNLNRHEGERKKNQESMQEDVDAHTRNFSDNF